MNRTVHIVRRAAGRLAAACCATVLAVTLALPGAALAADDAGIAESPYPEDALGGAIDALNSFAGGNVLTSDQFPIDNEVANWIVFDMARADRAKGADAYLSAYEDHVTQAYADADVKLDKYMPTAWGRAVMLVCALDGDPTSFGTDANGQPIDLVADGSYNWTQTNALGANGSNGVIYAISALDCSGAQVPADARYTVDDMLAELLACQNEDGSFGLFAGSGSTDLTGMALAALSRHADNPDVAAAIDRGVAYLSETQGGDGRYSAEDIANSESCSMVIIGLASNGIDPRTDERFVKNGVSLYDALLSFKREDGTFSHSMDDDLSSIEFMATEQAMRALVSVCELDYGGDGNPYTLDVKLSMGKSLWGGGRSAASLIAGIVVGAAIVVAVVFALARRRNRIDKAL